MKLSRRQRNDVRAARDLPSSPVMPNSADVTYESFQPSKRHKIAVAAVWILLIATYVFAVRSSDTGPVQTVGTVMRFVSDSVWGPLLFIGLYTVRPVFFFSAGLLSVAAGILFGPVLGILFTIIGSNLGAGLAYWIGRYFMQGASLPSRLEEWADRMRDFSFETVFLLRVMYVPYDMVNYAAGLLRVRFASFIVATMLGSLPGTVAFTLFGASAEGLEQGLPSFDVRLVLASAAIFLVSLAASRVIRARRSGKPRRPPQPD